jgi:predicted dehydrogenase
MDTVRWGVLGTAKIAIEKVIPAIQQAEGCEVVALASRDGGRAATVAGDLGIDRAYGSYEELLGAADVDVVYNPLPNHLHGEWSVAASRAGKHVLCEKPLGRTRDEARAIVDDFAPGLVLMEAFMYRFHPSWEAVRRLVAEDIGRLRAVHTRFSYFNDDPANIRNRPEFGGGALLDIGCYAVDLSRMLFGAEPTAVAAMVDIDPVTGVDVLSSGLLAFPTGHATFTVSTRGEPDQRVTVLGSDGRVEIEIPFNIPPDRPTRVWCTAGGEPPTDPDTETLTFPAADPYTLQAEAFAGAVREGRPAPLDPEGAVANLAVLDEVRARGRSSPGG